MQAVNNGQRELVMTRAKVKDIARIAGVSLPTASKWRRGQKAPAPPKRAKLLRAYGIPVDAWEQDAAREEIAPVAGEDQPAPRKGFPAYPTPPKNASTLDNARHALACIRHDITHRFDLSVATMSKLRADEARAVTLLAKLEHEHALTEARYVREHPEFRAHCKRVLEALRPFPAAAKAVLAAMTP